MEHKHWLLGLFCTCLTLLFISSACGQAPATMSYRNLLKLAQGNQVNDTNVKEYPIRISSNKGVPPQKIELILQTEAGPKFLFVTNKGVVNIPNSTSLYAENPLLVTNQPKDTLLIETDVVTEFKQPKIVGGQVTYQELFKEMLSMQKEIQKVDPSFGTPGNKQLVLKIKTNDPIKIVRHVSAKDRTVTGSRTINPHKEYIFMIFDRFMHEGNTTVIMPGTPKIGVNFATPEQLDKIKKGF